MGAGEATANPVRISESSEVDDVEAAYEALGFTTPEQRAALAVLMRSTDVRSDMIAAAKETYAGISTTPTNWHQLVTFCATSADSEHRRMAPALFGIACCMVLFQCTATVGILYGTIKPGCANNDQCQPGTFCHTRVYPRCEYCGSWENPPSGKLEPGWPTWGGMVLQKNATGHTFNLACTPAPGPTSAIPKSLR